MKSFILLLFCFISLSFEAGVALHLLLVSRSVIPKGLPLNYLLAGAFYPDSFYNCLGLSSIGEYDHWTPFLYELVRYHNGLPDEDLDLKLFIYGILNHQITDITWHSLRIHQGLLKFINNVEFGLDEDFTRSHSFIDSGGDFLILDRLLQNMSKQGREKVLAYFKTPWGIPAQHLVNVYHRLGYRQINEQNLNYCMLRGYTALQLEVSSMFLESNPSTFYKEQSPLFTDIFETYYLGGLQEIVHTLDKCLPNLEYWFNNIDKIKDSREICNTMAGSSLPKEEIFNISVQHESDTIFISSYIRNSYFGSNLVTGKFLGDDRNCIAISAPFEEGEGSIYLMPIDEFETIQMGTASSGILRISERDEKMEYAKRFGLQMLNFMDQFLLVSSPGSSSLIFYYKGKKILELKTPQSRKFIGENGLKQLGVLLELDEQTQDIIIGSKYVDYRSNEEQKGYFMVLNGKLILMKLLQILESASSSQSVQSNMNLYTKKNFQIPLFLNQLSNYENFASQYSSLHDYRAVSVDNLGIVIIYIKDTPTYIITYDLQILKYQEDAHLSDKIKKTSSLQNSQFGSNFLKFIEVNGDTYLIISAKSYKEQNCIQCGAGFMFAAKDDGLKLIAKISLSDKKNFNQFFHNALKISNTELLITSLNYNNRGSIWRLDLTKVIDHYKGDTIEWQLHQDDLVQLGPEKAGYTEFGASLAYVEGKLIVGMPSFGYNELEEDYLKLIGKVAIYS